MKYRLAHFVRVQTPLACSPAPRFTCLLHHEWDKPSPFPNPAVAVAMAVLEKVAQPANSEPTMKKITIATRGSKLALWQANHIKALLESKHSVQVELLVLKTKGDIILDVPLAKVGGKGLFVKEIEEALLDGRADIAVHSMKDVPMELPVGLTLGVIPQRENPADLLLSKTFSSLESLPHGAVVGTSSLRRQAQILSLRPDLQIISLRGNVDTRLRKLLDGEFDAIVMAAAGMHRLGLKAPCMSFLEPPQFLPAAGQGALGLEFDEKRQDIADLLAFLDHKDTHHCVLAERAFLAGLEGGCQVPIAAFATLASSAADADLTLEGFVANPDGTEIIRQKITATRNKAKALGFQLAESVKNAGGALLLHALYEEV